jgi:hypothetical protein
MRNIWSGMVSNGIDALLKVGGDSKRCNFATVRVSTVRVSTVRVSTVRVS